VERNASSQTFRASSQPGERIQYKCMLDSSPGRFVATGREPGLDVGAVGRTRKQQQSNVGHLLFAFEEITVLPRIVVIIPALNEAAAIGQVIEEIPRDLAARVIVCDNGSTDDTAAVARAAGATVVYEAERGYGAACLRAISSLPGDTDIVVFLDADHSDFPEDMPALLAPLLDGSADLVIGSRTKGKAENGALLPHQRFGNRLATTLIYLFWGVRYSDLGPFRAIRRDALAALDMRDRNFGWTIEMQIKAIQNGLKTVEVPARYRVRIGESKISGTITGSVKAGAKILGCIFRFAIHERRARRTRAAIPQSE
jgi:glycosyltransferase involved in cell wall biosynthesis